MCKNIIDDGFRADLVETALFDGCFEIPSISKPDEIIIPEGIVPFTKRKRDKEHKNFVCFYEHDIKFRDCVLAVDKYIDELSEFLGVISPDCSLYLDMPLCLQIANVYMNRASLLENITINKEPDSIILEIDFCYWQQAVFVDGDKETGMVKLRFSECAYWDISNRRINSDEIIKVEVTDNTIDICVESDLSNDYHHIVISSSNVEFIEL